MLCATRIRHTCNTCTRRNPIGKRSRDNFPCAILRNHTQLRFYLSGNSPMKVEVEPEALPKSRIEGKYGNPLHNFDLRPLFPSEAPPRRLAGTSRQPLPRPKPDGKSGLQPLQTLKKSILAPGQGKGRTSRKEDAWLRVKDRYPKFNPGIWTYELKSAVPRPLAV